MSEHQYRVIQTDDSYYETLVRPNGTEVATITEPEDRTFGRDLHPIVKELNALHAALEAVYATLEAENRRLKEAVGKVLPWLESQIPPRYAGVDSEGLHVEIVATDAKNACGISAMVLREALAALPPEEPSDE